MDAFKRTFGLSPTTEMGLSTTDNSTSMVIVDRVGAPPVLQETGSGPGSQSNNSTSSEEGLQVRDRLVNIWNNMKFSKTLWSLELPTSGNKRLSRLSPAWLLGQSYVKPSSRSSSFSSEHGSNAEEAIVEHNNCSPLVADLQSKIWLTYRKGFECFPRTSIDSDCGWGCMIR